LQPRPVLGERIRRVRPGSISNAGGNVVSCSMMRWMVRSPTVNLRLMLFPA
jgi:hypothetical protein